MRLNHGHGRIGVIIIHVGRNGRTKLTRNRVSNGVGVVLRGYTSRSRKAANETDLVDGESEPVC